MFKQDGYGVLCGSNHQCVIPYIDKRIRVVLLCVLFNFTVELA
jgi:hypothetical protein